MAEEVYPKMAPEDKGRATRGLQLYVDKGSEIVEYLDGSFGIPSATIPGWIYNVVLEAETCECRDFEIRGGVCLHQITATIFAAKRTLKALKPKRKASRFSGDWTDGIPSDEWLDRMGVA